MKNEAKFMEQSIQIPFSLSNFRKNDRKIITYLCQKKLLLVTQNLSTV